MSKRADTLYLQDIRDSLKKIEDYTSGVPYEFLVKSDEKIDAVVRNLEIIGEAAKNVSAETRKKYSKVPWKEIVGMRNKIIHEYFGVDFEILWKTLQNDLPLLKKALRQ